MKKKRVVKLTDEERLVASTETNSDVERLHVEQLKKTYRNTDIWQIMRDGTWRDLPVGYEPGWFYDEQYRRKPSQHENVFSTTQRTYALEGSDE